MILAKDPRARVGEEGGAIKINHIHEEDRVWRNGPLKPSLADPQHAARGRLEHLLSYACCPRRAHREPSKHSLPGELARGE